jgi:Arylsulfotransferase (ASST)
VKDASGAVVIEAPVDLTAPGYRTLLLGMKQGATYTATVVGAVGAQNVVSNTVTVEAGYLSNSLPQIQVQENAPGASFGGYTINCNGVGGAAPGQDTTSSWAFVFDKDGEYVWAYDLAGTPAEGCSRARMSHDGRHLWVGTFSNTTSANQKGALMRVSMDGLEVKAFSSDPTAGSNVMVEGIQRRHHDFTIIPNGHVLYQERNGDQDSFPDTIKELDPEAGTSTVLYNEETDFSALSGFHTNYVRYIPSLNAFSFSMRHSNTIVLMSYPDAQMMGIFSGEMDQFGMDWTAQHGHQFIDGKLLVFNNTNGGPANVLSFGVDLEGRSSTANPVYTGGPTSIAFGDVQRLPNGNVWITYSNAGVFHEVDASNQLVKTVTTSALGYSEHRKTLYGAPPHFED